MYTGYLLSTESRTRLLQIFPPSYTEVMGHHVTYSMGGKAQPLPPNVDKAQVIGYINDGESVEGLTVSLDGETVRPDGKTFHITWSIDTDKGAKPFHTNQHTQNAEKLTVPIDITVTPKLFKGSTKEEMTK